MSSSSSSSFSSSDYTPPTMHRVMKVEKETIPQHQQQPQQRSKNQITWECPDCGKEVNRHSKARHLRNCKEHNNNQPYLPPAKLFAKATATDDEELEINCGAKTDSSGCKQHLRIIGQLRDEVTTAKAAKAATEYELKRTQTEVIRLEVLLARYDVTVKSLMNHAAARTAAVQTPPSNSPLPRLLQLSASASSISTDLDDESRPSSVTIVNAPESLPINFGSMTAS